MKRILTAVLMVLAPCTGALAAEGNESLIAKCSVPDGYRLFPVEESTHGAANGPSGELGFAGTVIVTRDASGRYDLRYKDRMREIFSLVGSGGVVTAGRSTESELVVFANYENETEVFTFSKKAPESLQFTLISSSPGHERIEKKANVAGRCTFVNFEQE